MSLKINSSEGLANKPAAVLFDLDNTLYDYATSHDRAMQAVREKLRALLNVSAMNVDQAFAEARADVKKRLGDTGASHSRLLYFHRMIECMGFNSQPLVALELEQTYWRTFMMSAELFPYVMEVLIELRALGLPLGLVTDLTTQIQFRKLVHFRIDRYFDSIVTSEEAGADKSQLAPFRLIADKMKLDQDSLVWVIGDDECDLVHSRQVLNAVAFQKYSEGGRTNFYPGVAITFSRFKNLWGLLKSLAWRPTAGQ